MSVIDTINTLFDFSKVAKKEVLNHDDDLDFQNFLKNHEEAIRNTKKSE